MNRQWKAGIMLVGCVVLTGCYVAESTDYYPSYNEDYIYSVGYYGYRPYNWGSGYYDTYGWGTRDWDSVPSPYRFRDPGPRMGGWRR
jgi:hypothetical protein